MKQNYGCIAIAYVFWLVIASIYNIKPDYEYGFVWGMLWHGPLIFPNWIISFFVPGKYCMAPLHTSGYTFWWWFYLVVNSYGIIGTFISLIKQFSHR